MKFIGAGARPGQPLVHRDAVFTVPNVLTVVRFLGVPLFIWLVLSEHEYGYGALVLAIMASTDWVDGYIARRFNQTSDLGKVLDPVADRLLFFVGVGGILVDGSVPGWFAVAVLVREALVAGATLALAMLGARRIDVTWFGKAGTFFLMIAFPLFLASESTVGWADTAGTLAWIALFLWRRRPARA